MATATDSNRPEQVQTLELYDENNDEHRSLSKVPGSLTWTLFVVCIIELGERFVYLSISSPLQNYIQNPYPYNDAGIPGALGRGQSVGVALGNFFKFWSYLCVVGGAVVSDQYLGKFKTIVASTPIYVLGMVVLVATSTPAAIQHGAAMPGLVVAIILLGVGTGGLKACIAPMCGEQSRVTRSYVRTRPGSSGAREVVDVKMTSARIYLWYYWAANLGSLSGLATTTLEKAHGFWPAYLLPLVVFLVTFGVFLLFRRRLVHVPPSGSPIVDAWHTLRIAVREKGFANASPSALAANGRFGKYKFAANERYTDRYVADIKGGVSACKYFVLFPFFFLTWIQSFSNLISQAGSMDVGATPNDLMVVMSTIFMLGLIPILDILVYPFLRKQFKIVLNPVLRVCLGFISAGLGMAWACVLQYFIYRSAPNSIDLWIQAPAYVFLALSEIWVVVTGLEIAFLKAPEALRAFVSSIFWVTVASGAVIGIIMAPVSKDPYMVWLYGSLAICAFVAGVVFFFWFRDDIKHGPVITGQVAVLEGVPDPSAKLAIDTTIVDTTVGQKALGSDGKDISSRA